MRTLRLLMCSLALISGAHAKTIYSNKTFLRTRETDSFYLPAAHMAQPRALQDAKTTLSATLFQRSGYNHYDMGTYFAFGLENRKTQEPMIEVITGDNVSDSAKLNSDFFFSENTDPAIGTNAANCSIRLRPTYQEYGVGLNLTYKISNATAFSISAPITHIETSMKALFTDSRDSTQNYFIGARVDKDKHDMIEMLKHQRISEATPHYTHIADISLALTRSFTHDGAGVDVSLTGIIPTAGQASTRHLFSPKIGTGGHLGIGSRIAARGNVTRYAHTSTDFYATVDYTYLLTAKETRTPGIYSHRYNRPLSGGAYRSIVEKGVKIYFPGPNVLTRTVVVTPGSQFSAVLGTQISSNNLALDLSYNLFIRQKEEISQDPNNLWPARQYGAITYYEDSDADFEAEAPVIGDEAWTFGGYIKAPGETTEITTDSDGNAVSGENDSANNLWLDACASPADITHMLSASLSWHIAPLVLEFEKKSYVTATSFSLGGSYEFSGSGSNHGMRSWSVWTKLSASF